MSVGRTLGREEVSRDDGVEGWQAAGVRPGQGQGALCAPLRGWALARCCAHRTILSGPLLTPPHLSHPKAQDPWGIFPQKPRSSSGWGGGTAFW